MKIRLIAIGLIGVFSIFSQARYQAGEDQQCDRERIASFRAKARIYGSLYNRYEALSRIWKAMAQDHRNIARELTQYPALVSNYNNEAGRYESEARDLYK